MKNHKFKTLWIILAIVVLLGLLVAQTYNGMVRAEEDVRNAWSQVETTYQRRADLIPNLVETVKGYAQHESETFEKIAQLRSGYKSAQTPEEFEKLDQNFRASINVAIEAYPELKANENFLSLQDELAGTENRIAVARRDYNQTATSFNKSVRTFPRNLIANFLGFEAKSLFRAQAGAENAPTVNFGGAKGGEKPAEGKGN